MVGVALSDLPLLTKACSSLARDLGRSASYKSVLVSSLVGEQVSPSPGLPKTTDDDIMLRFRERLGCVWVLAFIPLANPACSFDARRMKACPKSCCSNIC
jgi:hypothetical protein